MFGHQAILNSSSSGGVNYFEVTYAEMIQLVENGLLIPGSYYLITDFQTIYDQPDYWLEGSPKEAHELVTKVSGTIEPLLCIASGLNTLELQVYSLLYSNDVIHYDVRFLQTEIKGTPAKGRIIYRKDEKNNVTGYDHTHIYFKRYNDGFELSQFPEYKDNGNGYDEFLTFGWGSSNNNLLSASNRDYLSDFLLPNNVFEYAIENVAYAEFTNNYFSDFENNFFLGNVIGNKVKGSCIGNNIRHSFKRNDLNNFDFNTSDFEFVNNNSQGSVARNKINQDITYCSFADFKKNTVDTWITGIDFTTAVIVQQDYNAYLYNDKTLGNRLMYFDDIQIFANITD